MSSSKYKHKRKEVGAVYIVVNKSMPGMVKIGMTGRDPYTRANELNGTHCPTEYEVVAYVYSNKYVELEKEIHRILEEQNVKNKQYYAYSKSGSEWFYIDCYDAIVILESAYMSINIPKKDKTDIHIDYDVLKSCSNLHRTNVKHHYQRNKLINTIVSKNIFGIKSELLNYIRKKSKIYEDAIRVNINKETEGKATRLSIIIFLIVSMLLWNYFDGGQLFFAVLSISTILIYIYLGVFYKIKEYEEQSNGRLKRLKDSLIDSVKLVDNMDKEVFQTYDVDEIKSYLNSKLKEYEEVEKNKIRKEEKTKSLIDDIFQSFFSFFINTLLIMSAIYFIVLIATMVKKYL